MAAGYKMRRWKHSDLAMLFKVKLSKPFKLPGSNLILEEYHITLNFKDNFSTADSVMNFLDSLGFRVTDKGYQYIVTIVSGRLEKMETFKKLSEAYTECAKQYKVSKECVEQSIIYAIKTAGNTGKLERLNTLFNCDFVKAGHISNDYFLSLIINRFLNYKKHDETFSYTVE